MSGVDIIMLADIGDGAFEGVGDFLMLLIVGPGLLMGLVLALMWRRFSGQALTGGILICVVSIFMLLAGLWCSGSTTCILGVLVTIRMYYLYRKEKKQRRHRAAMEAYDAKIRNG